MGRDSWLLVEVGGKAFGGVGYDVVFIRFFERLCGLGVPEDDLIVMSEAVLEHAARSALAPT